MGQRVETHGWVAAWLAAGVSAVLLYVANGRGSAWPLAWIALAPVLWYALGPAPTRRAALALAVAFVGGSAYLVPVYRHVMPAPAIAVALAVPALVSTGVTLLARYAAHRLGAWGRLLVFPALWTAYELWVARSSAHGTAGSLAYTQLECWPVLQLAALTGASGVTFLITLLNWGLALAARTPSAVWRCAGVPALLFAGAAAGGAWHASRPAHGPVVRVGLAASDADLAAVSTTDEHEALAVLAAYAGRVQRLAEQGAQIVVLPEKLVAVRPAWAGAARTLLAEAARRARVTLVIGLNEFLSDGSRRNLALVWGPDGRLLAEYDKHHLLPAFESAYRAGHTPGLLAGGLGVAICKDLDFSDTSREHGRAGTGLLLVPAWDFVTDAALHGDMAALRGVEGGFAVARSARQGLLAAWDAHGRRLAQTPSFTASEALLVVDVRPGSGRTPYTRLGDVFGAVAAALAASLLVAARWRPTVLRYGAR